MSTKTPQLAFVNRIKEAEYLRKYFKSTPNAILFLYGPKSCGKTTLIEKVIQNDLEKKKYAVNYLNLRRIIIRDFKSFLDVFFQKSSTRKAKDIISSIVLNIGFFKVGLEDEEMMRKNAFKVMEDKLRKANQKGIKPIIIIDEIQNLKSIYMNGEKRLLDELFNFFISLTKETHLAHIVLATSDSYFIEEIYNSAKLSKTSDFYLVNHLEKKDIEDWLGNYSEYSFTKKEINYIYNYLGGSSWEIKQVLLSLSNGDDIKEAVKKRIKLLRGQVNLFYDSLDEAQAKNFKKVSSAIAKKGVYFKKERDGLDNIIPLAIEKDIWFYEASERKIIPNSPSLQHVFLEVF